MRKGRGILTSGPRKKKEVLNPSNYGQLVTSLAIIGWPSTQSPRLLPLKSWPYDGTAWRAGSPNYNQIYGQWPVELLHSADAYA